MILGILILFVGIVISVPDSSVEYASYKCLEFYDERRESDYGIKLFTGFFTIFFLQFFL